MNLNETPRGTLLYQYTDGEYVRLLGLSRGCCLLETESGEHYAITQQEAYTASFIKVSDPERDDVFTRNAALGSALRAAELATLRRMNFPLPEEEQEIIAETLDGIQASLEHLIRRISEARKQEVPGKPLVKAFLDDLEHNHASSGLFLGRQVMCEERNTLVIDGTRLDRDSGIKLLAGSNLHQKTLPLSTLLHSAKNRSTPVNHTKAVSSREHTR